MVICREAETREAEARWPRWLAGQRPTPVPSGDAPVTRHVARPSRPATIAMQLRAGGISTAARWKCGFPVRTPDLLGGPRVPTPALSRTPPEASQAGLGL